MQQRLTFFSKKKDTTIFDVQLDNTGTIIIWSDFYCIYCIFWEKWLQNTCKTIATTSL